MSNSLPSARVGRRRAARRRGRPASAAAPSRWLNIIVRPNGVGSAAISSAVVAARQRAGDGAGRVAAEPVGDDPFLPDERLPAFVGRFPVAAVGRSACQLRSSTVMRASPRLRAPSPNARDAPSVRRSRCRSAPTPPYSSDPRSTSRICQTYPSGGATSGSAKDAAHEIPARDSRRASRSSDGVGVTYRSTNASGAITAPSTDAAACCRRTRRRCDAVASRSRCRRRCIDVLTRPFFPVAACTVRTSPDRAVSGSAPAPPASRGSGTARRTPPAPSAPLRQARLRDPRSRETARGAELLSLKQHRRRRHQEQQRASWRGIVPGDAALMQPCAVARVRDLIVILDEVDERGRRNAVRVGVPRGCFCHAYRCP